MLARSLVILRLLVLQLLLLAPATAMARTISWSGYEWDVRPPGLGDPGPNQWSDSAANVRVEGSDLVLSIVKDASGCWTSAEVDNRRHLGYGTYRWIVASDLSGLDAADVLGMFTYTDSLRSHNEIDLEASHWGNLSWPSGSATLWQGGATARSESKSFRYSNRPPYVHQFRWEPGRITYLVTDAAGAVLLDKTMTRGVPEPSSEVPMINFWRFENAPPAGERSMRISSFTWIPLGVDDAPPLLGPVGAGGNPGGEAGGGNGPGCVRVAMSPRRFRLSGPGGGATLTWAATTRPMLRMLVERRRGGRWVGVGNIRRVVRKRAGHLRFRGRIGGHPLRRGHYRLVIRSTAGRDRLAPGRTALRFTVLGR
jgi:hypothetical protein